jgi:hypothetical protein
VTGKSKDLERRFKRLASQWKRATLLSSKVSAMVMHPAYQKIIGMGPAAVPLILGDLQKNGPEHWFWALEAITDENPVSKKMAGDIHQMTEAWLRWGKTKGQTRVSWPQMEHR